MPITINGSGTVTGISVGGLPDGIVDADMIATGAVTSAKVAAGAVVQTVTETNSTTSQLPSANDTWTAFGPSPTITVTGSNDVLVIISSSAIAINNGYLGHRLKRGSTVLNTNWGYTNTSTWVPAHNPISSFLDAAPGAGTYTYTLECYTDGSYDNFNQNYHGDGGTRYSSMTLLEVKR